MWRRRTRTTTTRSSSATADTAQARRNVEVKADNRAAEAWAGASLESFLETAACVAGQHALSHAADRFDDAGKIDKGTVLRCLSAEAWVFAGALGTKRRGFSGGGFVEEVSIGEINPVAVAVLPSLRDRFALAEAGGGHHALALVWRARTRRAITARRDPILPRITLEPVNAARARGELLTSPGGRAGLRAAALPLFPDADHELLSVPLLDVADIATGVRAVSSGHGASHEIRLLVEGVLSISAGDREGDGIPIAWTVGELLQALYASSKHMHRAGDRPGDWALIRRAALWVDHAAIPWRVPSGNLQSWFLMRLRTLPGERPGLDDPVVFDVRLPPGAGIGPVIDREALRAAARVSSPAYRIGIGVPSLTWIPGVTRPPMRGPGGVWTGDPRRYPVLSDRDRRRIAFGPDDDRKQAHVDDAWRKRADAAGVVILDTEAVDRDGKRGWHVVTISAAEAIRKARLKG